jgi:oligosaccharide repeat unit polymerase
MESHSFVAARLLPARRNLAIGCFIGLASLLGGYIAVNISIAHLGVWLPLSLTAFGCLTLFTYSFRIERDPFSPLLLLSIVFFILYVLRPLYILADGRYGPTNAREELSVEHIVLANMTIASSLVDLALFALAAGYLLYRNVTHTPDKAHGWKGIRSRLLENDALLRINWVRLQVLLVCSGLLMLGVYYDLIHSAGGLSAYISSLSTRASFFYGQAYLTQVVLPFTVAVFVYFSIVLLRPNISRPQRLTVSVLLLLTMVGDALTGGRAALILGALLPLGIIFQMVYRPIKARTLFVGLSIALVFFVGSRVLTRDSQYSVNASQSAFSLFVSQLSHLPAATIGGKDAVPYDSLVTLAGAEQQHLSSLQYGTTYLPIITFLIPRAIWPNKPLGGANTWFTQRYYPEFYGKSHTETSVSEIGELYLNFGAAGVLLVMFLLGVAVAALYRRVCRTKRLKVVLLYALTMGYLLTLIRGDAYHSVTSWGLTAILLIFTFRFIGLHEAPDPI